MARISSYPYDAVVTDNDAWIGTEASNRQTKQFTASAVAIYLNINGKVNIGGQMSFKWSDTQNGGEGSISKTGGGGSGSNFNTLTSIRISIKELNGQNVVKFLEYITSKPILLGQGTEISQFGHYTLDTYAIDPNDSNYYIATLTYIGGNGTIATNGTIYTLIHFDINDSTGTTFVYTQGAVATVWTIQHNLNKYPSVMAVDIQNLQYFGAVEYIDLNNLTITWGTPFKGFAYLN